MARKTVAGLNALIRRALASHVSPPAPETVADPVGLDGLRMMAETRALAAEIIAQEANAIRLKALLDAARDQAANRNIRSAEERFAAAKDEWDTVRQGLQPEPDPYAEPDPASVPPAQPATGTVPASPEEMDEATWRNWLLLGGLPMLAVVMAAGIAIHFHSGNNASSIATEQVARPAVEALDAPLSAIPSASAPAVETKAAEIVPIPRAKEGTKIKTAVRIQPAAGTKKARQQTTAQPPRTDPAPDELAAGERARVESIWADHVVE